LIATVVARARFATGVVRVRFGINVGRNKCQRGDGIDGDDGELSEGLVVEQVGWLAVISRRKWSEPG
jgi:hypothetical protein